jgi:hypothetical protein
VLALACSDPAPAATTTLATACTPSASQIGSERELYVADVFEIAGHADREDALFAFARARGVTRLAIYGHRVLLLDTPNGEASMVSFVTRARAAGISSLAATIGWDAELDSLLDYERAHPDAAFDELVTEIEYWHDCDAADDGVVRACFAPLRAMIDRIRALEPRPRLGVYLGWPTRAEAELVAPLVDRVLLAAEQPTPERAYGHRTSRARLAAFAGRAPVWPILYARGESHLGAWLETHASVEAERIWTDAWRAEREPWACALRVGGFTWFDYGALSAGTAGGDRGR